MADRDAAHGFDVSEDFYHVMSVPTVPCVEAGRLPKAKLGWDAGRGASFVPTVLNLSASKPFSHNPATTKADSTA